MEYWNKEGRIRKKECNNRTSLYKSERLDTREVAEMFSFTIDYQAHVRGALHVQYPILYRANPWTTSVHH